MTVVKYSSQPDEVHSLKSITKLWSQNGFWSFDDCLDFLRLNSSVLFYEHSEDDDRWQVTALFSIALDQSDLIYIYTPDEFRKRGLATTFLHSCLEQLREAYKVKSLFLEVRPGNESALSLYSKLGFEKCGYRKKYYQDGEDAIVMSKTL